MERLINKLVELCVAKEIIKPENKDWFRYGIEKRLSTICVGIPFFLLAILLSDFLTATAFFISFFFLRSRINGYHANSIIQCLMVSLGLEILFLGLINPILNSAVMGILMTAAVALVFFLAPYNHPNMALTKEEILVCRKSARIRIIVLLLCFVLAACIKQRQLAAGITLGCAMAGGLLCFAYISEWRINHGKRTDEGNENA